jgi:plasmid segregation protein ParM
MCAKIGEDIGSFYAKSSEGKKFENRITEDRTILSGSAMRVKFNGLTYLIENGTFDINVNKVLKKNLIVSVATLLALSTEDTNVELGIGLPINFYSSQKDTLHKMIMDNQDMRIELNGEKKRYIIKKCTVIPEAVGVYYSLSTDVLNAIGKREVLMIDVGGKTTDMCIIDYNSTIKKPATLPLGMLNLYNFIANKINADNPDLCVTIEDMKDILDNGLNVFDKELPIPFIDNIQKSMVEDIFNYIKIQYQDYQRKVIVLCGGGHILEDYFRVHIPNLIVNKDIFANAVGFKKYLSIGG